MNEIWNDEAVLNQTRLIADSLKFWTGRKLLPGEFSPSEYAEAVFRAPFVLVSHGTEPDPILNYGNLAALTLWEMSWPELTRQPSRLTAEPLERSARARFLAAVAEKGFIDDYSGIRISKTGHRFAIEQATVWNLLDHRNHYAGQAAMFCRWKPCK